MSKILKSSDSDFLKKFHDVVNYDRSEILDVSSVVSEIIKNVKEKRLKTICFVIIKIIEAIKIVLIENRVIAIFQSSSIRSKEVIL